MIYPEKSVAEWEKQTGLKADQIYDCPNCGKSYPCNVPILGTDIWGFESTIHECTWRFTKCVFTPRSAKCKAEWDFIMRHL